MTKLLRAGRAAKLRVSSALTVVMAALLVTSVAPAQVVDEPQGLRSNHGLTLWHLRHDPKAVGQFHGWLREQGLAPKDLLSAEQLRPPATTAAILIEPENLANLPAGPWRIEPLEGASNGGTLTADATAHGYLPLWVVAPRADTYRMWIRYHAHQGHVGVIGVRLYPTGAENPLPLVDLLVDEFVAEETGWRWASFLVDLPAEPVELRLVCESPENQAPGPRSERRVDCIYFTTAGWAEAPSLEDLSAVYHSGRSIAWPVVEPSPRVQSDFAGYAFRRHRLGAVRVLETPFDASGHDAEQWQWWTARPADWSMRDDYPALFDAGYRFWRGQLEALGRASHDPLPDYRDPSRQIVFDDQWNLVGNPVMIARQVERLKAAVPSDADGDHYYDWIEAEKFSTIEAGWTRSGRGGNSEASMRPSDENAPATLSHRVQLDRAGRYALWLRTGILGESISPLRVQIKSQETEIVSQDFVAGDFPSDAGSDWTWHRIEVEGDAGQALEVIVTALPKNRLAPLDDAVAEKSGSFFQWVEAEAMDTIAYDWGITSRSGNSGDACIGMGVDATGGVGYAAHEVSVDRAGAYYLWLRKIADGKDTPLRVSLLGPEVAPEVRTSPRHWSQRWTAKADDPVDAGEVRHDLDRRDYERDAPGEWTWQRIGPLKVDEPGNVRVEVHRRHYAYIYEGQALTPEVRGALGGHAFDCLVLTDDADYVPRGIRPPGETQPLYLRPAVDALVVTDDLQWQPRRTQRPQLSRASYQRVAALRGAEPGSSFLWWVEQPYAAWRSDDWPAVDRPRRLDILLPRGATLASSIRLRSLADDPTRLDVRLEPLTNEDGEVVPATLEWRVVGHIAPTWAPVPLLRRPYIVVPPFQTAAIWLTANTSDLEPGTYHSTITLEYADSAAQVPVTLHVSSIAAAPRQPILLGGYHPPSPGLVWAEDFKAHGINLSRLSFPGKAERERWGYRMVNYALSELGPQREADLRTQLRGTLERMRTEQVSFEEALWEFGDEPSGTADAFAFDGKIALEMAPQARVLYNPGSRAGLETFQALEPYAVTWAPYIVHFAFPDRVAIFTARPYFFYTVHSGDELSAHMPAEVYEEIRSVPARPGECLGMRIYTINRALRDAWDTAYQVLPGDEGVFMYPSRHGPIPTRGWEAMRDAGVHANLARMLKELAEAADVPHAHGSMVEDGSIIELLQTIAEVR